MHQSSDTVLYGQIPITDAPQSRPLYMASKTHQSHPSMPESRPLYMCFKSITVDPHHACYPPVYQAFPLFLRCLSTLLLRCFSACFRCSSVVYHRTIQHRTAPPVQVHDAPFFLLFFQRNLPNTLHCSRGLPLLLQ